MVLLREARDHTCDIPKLGYGHIKSFDSTIH